MKHWPSAAFFAPFFLCITAFAQTAPTHTFHDPAYKLSFDYLANWNFSQTDGEISTFRLDAHSVEATTVLRTVVAMPENPFPASTFSGAYLYFSVTPHSSEAACAKQATSAKPGESTQIGGIPFAHGHEEQKAICTTQRDEIFTALHRGACYRFDLAINTFCGGDVSHVKDITPQELDQIRARLESILATVHFDTK